MNLSLSLDFGLMRRLRQWSRRWARKRHGIDPDPLILPSRRIYILPTGLGIAFTLMLFAMFIGAMNYANNLALGLTFLLGSLALIAMHYCHRNLSGIVIRSASSEPVFAGHDATFHVALENTAPLARHELLVANDQGPSNPQLVPANGRAVFDLQLPAPRRGLLTLDHFEIVTRHPFSLFRAWTHVHMNLTCVVYPKPAARGLSPPPVETDTGGAQDSVRGDEEFAGMRPFHPGDSPRRIAWKAYAREQGLQVKLYAGTAVTSHVFDWNGLNGLDTERRLSQLCRWIEDAYAEGRAFALKLPGLEVPANIGPGHRQRCLTALALFEP
ncbi:DUF58 domain-containing protein [Steroidobacter agaridevorans]|uniref:DUF58 domain-containing protein n=1 Tax=Steroidobacter agaridevorans TaxID=2695856 RepID=UPI001322817B|nr:DUF58 domain-containing protein [Steroidobacter agaridevorans]GFE90919.1 hypothetical protein GCM10011488_58730 [Steroidobacter agaridevorans]